MPWGGYLRRCWEAGLAKLVMAPETQLVAKRNMDRLLGENGKFD